MKLFLFLLLSMLSLTGFANTSIFDDDVGNDCPQVELVCMNCFIATPVSLNKETKRDLLSESFHIHTWSYHLLGFKEGLSELSRTISFMQDRTVLNYWLSFGLSH